MTLFYCASLLLLAPVSSVLPFFSLDTLPALPVSLLTELNVRIRVSKPIAKLSGPTGATPVAVPVAFEEAKAP